MSSRRRRTRRTRSTASRAAGRTGRTSRSCDLATKRTLDDTLEWVKVSGVAWHGDGFFYSRYPAPATGAGEGVDQREPSGLLPPDRHAAVTGCARLRGCGEPATVSHAADDRGRTVCHPHDLGARQGQGWQRAPRLRPLAAASRTSRPLVATISDDSFGVVDNVGDRLLVQTNRRAPNWRVVLIDPAHPEEGNWTDVLPERPSRCRARSRPAASWSRRI